MAVKTVPVHEVPELSMDQVNWVPEVSDLEELSSSEMPMMTVEYSRHILGEEAQAMAELDEVNSNSD